MSNISALLDNDLLRLIKESNHAAYNEIYRRYFHLLYNHTYKKLRDEEQAKDVIQEIFTSLWFKRETHLPESNLAGYLFTAVRYKIFDLYAREQSRTKYLDSVKEFMNTHLPESTDHLIRERQLNAYIQKEISKLPEKMRRVLEMSRKEGLSRKEISLLLNTTENSVSKNLSLALKILKAKMSLIVILYLFFGIS